MPYVLYTVDRTYIPNPKNNKKSLTQYKPIHKNKNP